VGINEAVAHPGLGGEVNYPVEFFPLEEFSHLLAVAYVHADEAVVRVLGAYCFTAPLASFIEADASLLQPSVFKADIVVVVYIVDADDFISPLKKAEDSVVSDEAGGSCDEYFHEVETS
jgi:hypothetical protein